MRSRTPQVTDGVTVEQLVALADGSLPEPDRGAVAERVAASSEATELLHAQQRALAAIGSFAPSAPPGLAARLRAAGAAQQTSRGLPRARFGLAAAAATAVLVLAIALMPGERGATIATMATISARPSLELPAPAPDGNGGLRRSFAGVQFPDWADAHGWRAVGSRRDSVEGQPTDTVYYQHTHHRIGYTVLSGSPVALPNRGQRVERGGVAVQLYRDGPRTVAVFERAGRTCVLAGAVHRDETLIKLATWRADGALRF